MASKKRKGKAKPKAAQFGRMSNPLDEANFDKLDPKTRRLAQGRVGELLKRFTAPPETVVEHVDRIGATIAVRRVYWWDEDENGPVPGNPVDFADGLTGPLLCFVVPYDELASKEAEYIARGAEIGQIYGEQAKPKPHFTIDDKGETYFTIDGKRVSDDGGEVIYRETREVPPSPHPDGMFYTIDVDGVGLPVNDDPKTYDIGPVAEDPVKCVCGRPESTGVVHRTAGPCYVEQLHGNSHDTAVCPTDDDDEYPIGKVRG